MKTFQLKIFRNGELLVVLNKKTLGDIPLWLAHCVKGIPFTEKGLRQVFPDGKGKRGQYFTTRLVENATILRDELAVEFRTKNSAYRVEYHPDMADIVFNPDLDYWEWVKDLDIA